MSRRTISARRRYQRDSRIGAWVTAAIVAILAALGIYSASARGDASAMLSEGGTGTGIRCTISAPGDVSRTDIFMELQTCSSLNDYPGCILKTWDQRGAVRRASNDRVDFDWSILPDERFYYGVCRLCLIDWSTEWAEAHPELERCAQSAPLLLGRTNGVALPEQGLLVGVLASCAFLALLAWGARRMLR